MPYRVQPDGVIECDAAQEAIELQRLLTGTSGGQKKNPGTKAESASPKVKAQPSYGDFWVALNPEARKLLRALNSDNAPLKGADLVARCGLKTTDLPGIMIHIRSTAKKYRIEEPVARKKGIEGRRPVSTYQLTGRIKEELKEQLASSA